VPASIYLTSHLLFKNRTIFLGTREPTLFLEPLLTNRAAATAQGCFLVWGGAAAPGARCQCDPAACRELAGLCRQRDGSLWL